MTAARRDAVVHSSAGGATSSWSGRNGRVAWQEWLLGATVLSVASVAALTAAQIHLARRMYAATLPEEGLIDTTVVPPETILADGLPLEIVTLGDSGMAGVGVDRLTDTLPVLIASRVAARTGRPVHVVSHGRSGARTRDVLLEQVALIRRQPDVTVVLVGTNDVTHLTSPLRLAGVTAALLAELTDLGAPVVMSSLPELRAMRAVPLVVRAILELEAVLVRRTHERVIGGFGRVQLVDVRLLVGHEFIVDPSTMSGDHFHPSATGYGRIADALAPAIAAVVVAKERQADLVRP